VRTRTLAGSVALTATFRPAHLTHIN
jgi:hypothetical protein